MIRITFINFFKIIDIIKIVQRGQSNFTKKLNSTFFTWFSTR